MANSTEFDATGILSGTEFNNQTQELSFYESEKGSKYLNSDTVKCFFASKGSIRSGVLSKSAAELLKTKGAAAIEGAEDPKGALRSFIAKSFEFGMVATGEVDESTGEVLRIPMLYPSSTPSGKLLFSC